MRRRWIVILLASLIALTIGLVVTYFAFETFTGDEQGFKDFCGEAQVIQNNLQQFFKNKKDYPAYTLAQLRRNGAWDENMDWYWVYYTPFSSQTPDDTIVLRMGYGPFGFIPWLSDFSWTKLELTHDSSPEQNLWKDRLEPAKEKQVLQIETQHPDWNILTAFASIDGGLTENSHASLFIDYTTPNDPRPYRIQYDLLAKNDEWVVGAEKSLGPIQ